MLGASPITVCRYGGKMLTASALTEKRYVLTANSITVRRYGGEALSGSHFGRGSGLIWLDDVSCDVTSRSLAACAHKGWTVNDCSHLEDAGVRCFTSRPTVTTSTTTTTTTPPSETGRLKDRADQSFSLSFM